MKKQILFILLFWGLSTIGYSQKTISGQINDASGHPLSGVNILEKGTNNGTSTDFEGKFSLTVQNDESRL
ncbi:MAG: carboxypeptidase-like regulatory domain-containing protein, partial [Flavobacterium sp.]|uniref:carboxypeptidase-like regulatory domain-containing protein n=1 Tax=Flavobacterium sp. TaxID=239 RepID=UPI00326495CD